MNKSRLLNLLVLFAVVIQPLLAGPIPGRWEKVDALQPGTRIIVKWTSGDKVEYIYKESQPDLLVVSDLTGSDQSIPKSEIERILHGVAGNDNVLDGLGRGAAIGFGASALFGLLCFGDNSEGGRCFAMITFLGTSMGAAIGLGSDVAVKGNTVIYRAP